MAISTWYC